MLFLLPLCIIPLVSMPAFLADPDVNFHDVNSD